MMKRNKKTGAAAVILLAAMGLAGCTSQVSTSVPNYIQVENVNTERTITIQANEVVKVVPDMAVIVYVVNTEDKDAQVCQKDNSEKVASVLEYLKGQGFGEASIATSGFSLDPMYDWINNRRVLTGYEMRTEITVSDVPMEKVGGMITQTVAAGANEILSVNYLSSKYDEAYQEALAKAVKQAKTKAEAMAHADGYQVAEVVSMEEYGDMQQGRYVDAGLARNKSYRQETAGAEGVADMAVMAGEMEVTAKIQVVFGIVPR